MARWKPQSSSLPDVTHDTHQAPGGPWVYRIYLDGVLALTSGGFLLQRDAASCGTRIASDPLVLLDFLKR